MVRVLGAVGVLVLVLAGVSGCAGIGTVTATTSPSSSVSASPGLETAPAGETTPAGAPTRGPVIPSATASASATASTAPIPTTARDYATALLLAWGADQQAQVAQLATPVVLVQLAELGSTTINRSWGHEPCVVMSGAAYCRSTNANGDVITLRVTEAALGQPQAVAEALLDRTTYPTSAVDYVRAFVEAWRNGNTPRMSALSTPTVVNDFRSLTPPTSYRICQVVGAASTSVRVYTTTGFSQTLSVSATLLARGHAVTARVATQATCTA